MTVPTRNLRIEESLLREPGHNLEELQSALKAITQRGFEAAPSGQVQGLFAISYPICDQRDHAIAALTVPYADRVDLIGRKTKEDVKRIVGEAAAELTDRMSGNHLETR